MGDRDRGSDRGARVYVGGLDDNIKKEDLEGEFEKFGKLNNVWIALNPPGFAFIEFSSLSDAENACDNLNGIDFLGSKLRVEIAKERRGGGFRGGRGRGGRGGGFRDDRGFRGGRFDGGRRGGGGFRGGRRDDGDRFGGRDFGRRSDSYSGGGGGGGGGSRGSGGRRFEGGSNYRSRSPMGGPRR